MANVKGNGLHFIRSQLLKRNEEGKFLALLSPKEMEIYQKKLAVNWIEINSVVPIYQKAAGFFYPESENKMVNMGKDMAIFHFTGIYKLFLRVATIEFLIQQTAKIWAVYYDKGSLEVKRDATKMELLFIVREFPELPKSIREMISGFLEGLLSLTNIRKIVVHKDDRNSNAWAWTINWEA